MDKIKAQKIKLDKDERNNTNNKNENDRHNMILSPIDKIYQYFEYKFLSKPDTQSDRQQPDQQQWNQNLRLWVTSTDDYTKLKNNVNKYYDTNFTFMLIINNLILITLKNVFD